MSIAVFGLGPLGPFQFHRQLDPLADQFAQPLVGGHLLAHLLHLFGANEAGAALALPGEAELVVGPVFAGILGVFAAAAGCAANVVLLADTAGMERPQIEELMLQLCDVSLDLHRSHAGSYILAIGYSQQKNAVCNKKVNPSLQDATSSTLRKRRWFLTLRLLLRLRR
jgi:hypothetical protein